MLKQSAKFYIILAIISVTAVVMYFINNEKPLYGNDEESIEQVIKSIEGYKNNYIEILEIKDIDDYRIVAFLTNNHPAYIEFIKNKDGNYKWKRAEKHEGESFASFLIHQTGQESQYYMFVTNQNNDIAKIELGVNEHTIEQEFNVNQKSVTWIELPQSNSNSYRFTYKYFDQKGNEIDGSH